MKARCALQGSCTAVHLFAASPYPPSGVQGVGEEEEDGGWPAGRPPNGAGAAAEERAEEPARVTRRAARRVGARADAHH